MGWWRPQGIPQPSYIGFGLYTSTLAGECLFEPWLGRCVKCIAYGFVYGLFTYRQLICSCGDRTHRVYIKRCGCGALIEQQSYVFW